MRHIAICDDEPAHLDYTHALVRRELPSTRFALERFSAPEQLLRAVEAQNYRPDIAILDICMGGASGIELAKRLNALAPRCKIIFLTSFLDYATEVYEAEHVYFVLKSEMEQRLRQALRKAEEALGAVRFLPVKQAKGTTLVPLEQVLFLERSGRKTRVQTEGEALWCAQTPQELLSAVPAEAFIRCHQSYWVRTAKILAMKNNDFYLPDGCRIPLSRTYRQAAKEHFFAALKEPPQG